LAGAMPRRVMEKYNSYIKRAAFHPETYENELKGSFGLIFPRINIAKLYGCKRSEICLSRNTTDGLDAVINGLEFNKGDEILTTNQEHIAAKSPMYVLQDRYGVVIKPLPIPVLNNTSADQFVELFKKNITDKTKAILFSHILWTTGARLPAKELCHLARENGLISIVDGVHCTGMIDLDFHDMGCDFYAASGHKWQCGPGGTGILYLRDHGENLPKYWLQNSEGYTISVQPKGNVRGKYDIGLALQVCGRLNIPAELAQVDACNMWATIGRDKIEKRVIELSSYLKKKLKGKFGSQGRLISPDTPKLISGLTTFTPFNDILADKKVWKYVRKLREEYGYQIKSVDFHVVTNGEEEKIGWAPRISTHIFNTMEQIDGLVDAMYDLYRKTA